MLFLKVGVTFLRPSTAMTAAVALTDLNSNTVQKEVVLPEALAGLAH